MAVIPAKTSRIGWKGLLGAITLAAALAAGTGAPAYAASGDFSSVTGESASSLTPCVMAGLASEGITSEQMLTDLLASGPRTRDAIANQLRAVEVGCASQADREGE